MEIKDIYKLFKTCSGISTDTRNIKEESMFFALKGENFNANKFADIAIQNGAKYAIIDEKEYKINNNFILVDSVLDTLQELANYHRQQIDIKIIAITGTNGKTTTKELLNAVLEQNFKVKATAGNFNNHIGVPLTLLGFDSDIDFGIVEMGANHKKEIEQLCKITEPDYGLITNIGKAHIEGFGSFEQVIKAKNELYDYLRANNKTIFYNAENKILSDLIENYQNKISFSSSDKTKYYCNVSDVNPFVCVNFFNKEKINICTNLVGVYNTENIAITCTIAAYFNMNNKQIKKGLETYTPKNNRSQLTITENNKIIIDAYNANPTSMNGAIDNFVEIKAQNKVLILGDMLELGKISEDEHKNIISKIDELGFKNVFFIGDIFYKFKNNKFTFFSKTNELAEHLKNNKIENSFILLKGSRGIRLESVLEFL
jgi:UDP-N-acetylmuramoyl-tripeptide--D-alanyl-D-alanine ligase